MPLLDSEILYEKVAFRLRADVAANLQAYARYLESSPDHILNSALAFVFSKDKDFQDWKLRQTGSVDGPVSGKRGRSKKPGVVNGTDSGKPTLESLDRN